MSNVLFIIGLIVFALACRTFQSRWMQRLSRLTILVTTYLAVYFFNGSHVWATLGASCWLLFPWIEILGRVRHLEFPIDYPIKAKFPPNQEIFPDLDELSQEIESSDFVQIDDTGWGWNESEHFIRVFYHEKNRTLAAFCISQENDFVMAHVSVSTRTKEGHIFETTNYPFSNTMKKLPTHHCQRVMDADSFLEILEAHTALLKKSQVTLESCLPQDPESIRSQMIEEIRQQIHHNLQHGLIVRTEDEQHFRYSMRGCFFLWVQILKDLIRS